MRPEKRPVMLTILDGWGYREDPDHNAIAHAHTPVWDRLWAQCPHTLITGSGEAVGLPAGQMGNSEVGHLNLGAGRRVPQDYTRITEDVRNGGFFTNPVLCEAADRARDGGTTLHILGLLSDGGVHSHQDHILAMAELAVRQGVQKLCVHAFLDGRDTPPRSALASIDHLQAKLDQLGTGHIASVVGRYFAMDRDQRWDRVKLAWDLLTAGRAPHHAPDARSAVEQAYARDESDEFVQPTLIDDGVPIGDGDVVVFMNFRSDRARQLTRAFCEEGFNDFDRGRCPQLAQYVCLTQYHADFKLPMAYPPVSLENGLGETVSNQGLRQLRIAETEKYAHVTFFFNGGLDQPFEGEERVLVPSPKVATYDLQPEMSAPEVTDRLVEAIASDHYDLIICNYANPDMVGHSGDLEAAMKAVEAVDSSLGRVVEAIEAAGGELLVTADHGNAEQLRDHSTGQAHTAHTSNPVPLVYVGTRQVELAKDGPLADIAPSLLTLMGLKQPAEMTGRSLVSFSEQRTAGGEHQA